MQTNSIFFIISLIIFSAIYLNFWLAKKRDKKAAQYDVFLREFKQALKLEDYPAMPKDGTEILCNWDLTTTDLNDLEKSVKEHVLKFPDLAKLELEIFQKRRNWESLDLYHRNLARF